MTSTPVAAPRPAVDAAALGGAAATARAAGTGTSAAAPTPLADPATGAVPGPLGAPDLAADPAVLRRVLDGRWPLVRERARATIPAAWCEPTDHLGTEEHRALTLARLRELAATGEHAHGFSSRVGGGDSTGAQTVQFEMLGHADLSLTIKAGVQWGLFAGSIQALGTAGHHDRYLRDAISADLLGCFAMTESGHGSDVANLETTATYDPASQEFVVHSPTPSARKEYIGGAARDARLAVVFAQLVTGGRGRGVHALLVPLRDADGAALPGVTISDCGRKAGLNGVDNGRLLFDAVRVPREALLDRYGSVAPDGTYTSSVASDSARFFTTLGALVKGRVCIAGGALAATRTGLAIALAHAERRRQFPRPTPKGAPRGEEVALLDYRTHQRRLLPLLATTVVHGLAQESLVAELHRVTNPVLLGAAPDPAAQRALEARAAGMKAELSWHATASLQAAREACGGAGYLSENRLPQLRADTDVFTTFEGDNTVLLQLAARHLLTSLRDELAAAGPLGQARAAAGTVVGSLAARTPARALAVRLADARPGHDEAGELLDRAWQLRTLAWRERRTTESLALRMRARSKAGAEPFEVTNAVQDHLVAAARAHVAADVAATAAAAVDAVTDPASRALLGRLLDLHVLAALEADRGWYLERGWLTPARSKALTRLVNDLCAQLRPHAGRVVEGFGLAPGWLGAEITR